MSSRVVCTLDQHRVGPSLTLSQGNVVVTTTSICDIHRSVFGTIAIGSGMVAFECGFWSTSRTANVLQNYASVGVVVSGECSLSKYCGEESASWGYLPGNGEVRNTNASISGSAVPALQPTPERTYIGVLLDCTNPAAPICSWMVNGSYIFQADLKPNSFYLPAVSIGSTAPGDISAYVNFGQSRFHYPFFQVNK